MEGAGGAAGARVTGAVGTWVTGVWVTGKLGTAGGALGLVPRVLAGSPWRVMVSEE